MKVQLSAGRGPTEVVAFLADLTAAFEAWVRGEGGRVGPPSWAKRRRSVILDVDGVGLSAWVGTHALSDAVRGKGQRRRWFVDVRTLDAHSDLAPFDPDAIRFQAARAGGPGGQHIHTTASAVRATYPPTGWQVRVASERSQHRNKAEAVRRLRARHQEAVVSQRALRDQAGWQAHVALQRGDPVQTWRRHRGRLIPSGSPSTAPARRPLGGSSPTT